MAKVVVEPLEKRHERKAFDCGNAEIDNYLRTLARQHQEKGFAKTYVAVEEGQNRVLGFVTVAMGNVLLEDADEAVFARLPRHPMPVLHIARLGTDRSCQGRGIASLLLTFAADLAIEASTKMGVYALELYAIDQAAYDYYRRRGFLPLKGDGKRLYAPLPTILAARSKTP